MPVADPMYVIRACEARADIIPKYIEHLDRGDIVAFDVYCLTNEMVYGRRNFILDKVFNGNAEEMNKMFLSSSKPTDQEKYYQYQMLSYLSLTTLPRHGHILRMIPRMIQQPTDAFTKQLKAFISSIQAIVRSWYEKTNTARSIGNVVATPERSTNTDEQKQYIREAARRQRSVANDRDELVRWGMDPKAETSTLDKKVVIDLVSVSDNSNDQDDDSNDYEVSVRFELAKMEELLNELDQLMTFVADTVFAEYGLDQMPSGDIGFKDSHLVRLARVNDKIEQIMIDKNRLLAMTQIGRHELIISFTQLTVLVNGREFENSDKILSRNVYLFEPLVSELNSKHLLLPVGRLSTYVRPVNKMGKESKQFISKTHVHNALSNDNAIYIDSYRAYIAERRFLLQQLNAVLTKWKPVHHKQLGTLLIVPDEQKVGKEDSFSGIWSQYTNNIPIVPGQSKPSTITNQLEEPVQSTKDAIEKLTGLNEENINSSAPEPQHAENTSPASSSSASKKPVDISKYMVAGQRYGLTSETLQYIYAVVSDSYNDYLWSEFNELIKILTGNNPLPYIIRYKINNLELACLAHQSISSHILTDLFYLMVYYLMFFLQSATINDKYDITGKSSRNKELSKEFFSVTSDLITLLTKWKTIEAKFTGEHSLYTRENNTIFSISEAMVCVVEALYLLYRMHTIFFNIFVRQLQDNASTLRYSDLSNFDVVFLHMIFFHEYLKPSNHEFYNVADCVKFVSASMAHMILFANYCVHLPVQESSEELWSNWRPISLPKLIDAVNRKLDDDLDEEEEYGIKKIIPASVDNYVSTPLNDESRAITNNRKKELPTEQLVVVPKELEYEAVHPPPYSDKSPEYDEQELESMLPNKPVETDQIDKKGPPQPIVIDLNGDDSD